MVCVDEKPQVCTDRHKRLLQSKVQVIREVVVPAQTEMALHCSITKQNYCSMGLIEGFSDGPSVASSLNQPGLKGQVIARCLNTMGQLLTLKSSATIDTYIGVNSPQIEEDDSLLWTTGSTPTNDVWLTLRSCSKRLNQTV